VVLAVAKSNNFTLQLGRKPNAHDAFLSARLAWTSASVGRLVLRVRTTTGDACGGQRPNL
jgi:hypothetical protein